MSAKTRSLEEIFKTYGIKQCDFMKMGRKGSEYDIIFNTPDETLQKIAKMAIEVHDAGYFSLDPEVNNEMALIKRLQALGFEQRWYRRQASMTLFLLRGGVSVRPR